MLARIELVVVAVLLVVELLGVLASVTLRFLTVDVVGALGLAELVDLTTSKAGDELLGEGVGDWLAWKMTCVST